MTLWVEQTYNLMEEILQNCHNGWVVQDEELVDGSVNQHIWREEPSSVVDLNQVIIFVAQVDRCLIFVDKGCGMAAFVEVGLLYGGVRSLFFGEAVNHMY